MTAQHTPGPWNGQRYMVNGERVGNRWAHVLGADGRIVCTFHASQYTYRNDAEISANVNLIEGAPALLAFAQWIIGSDPEGQTSLGPLFVKARAAIAKATGSTS